MKKLLVLSMSMFIAMSANAGLKEFKDKFNINGKTSTQQIEDNIISYYSDFTGKLCKEDSLRISQLKKQGKSFEQAEKIMLDDKDLEKKLFTEIDILKDKKENKVTDKFLMGIFMNLALTRTVERANVHKKHGNVIHQKCLIKNLLLKCMIIAQ